MVKVSSEKKREYNENYRNKQKEKKTEVEIVEEPKVVAQEPKVVAQEPVEEPEPAPQVEEPTEDGDSVLIERETLLLLIERAKLNDDEIPRETRKEIPREDPKQQSNEDSFFFLVQRQLKSTVASLVPILAIQGVIHGSKLLKNSIPNSISPSTQNQPRNSQFHSTDAFVPRVFNLD
jgi:hypothetical protein